MMGRSLPHARFLISPVAVKPSISGIITSINTRSTRPASAWQVVSSIASASRPLRAILTVRSEEHTSELQSLMRISYAVFCLKKKKKREYHLYHYHKNHHTKKPQT